MGREAMEWQELDVGQEEGAVGWNIGWAGGGNERDGSKVWNGEMYCLISLMQ